jgi:hypothetical protein
LSAAASIAPGLTIRGNQEGRFLRKTIRHDNAARRPQAPNVTLLDSMIAVTGFAISLWLRPVGWEKVIPTAIAVAAERPSARMAIGWSCLFLANSQSILAVWTLTVLVLGLRQRQCRQPLRRLGSQPGHGGLRSGGFDDANSGSVATHQ